MSKPKQFYIVLALLFIFSCNNKIKQKNKNLKYFLVDSLLITTDKIIESNDVKIWRDSTLIFIKGTGNYKSLYYYNIFTNKSFTVNNNGYNDEYFHDFFIADDSLYFLSYTNKLYSTDTNGNIKIKSILKDSILGHKVNWYFNSSLTNVYYFNKSIYSFPLNDYNASNRKKFFDEFSMKGNYIEIDFNTGKPLRFFGSQNDSIRLNNYGIKPSNMITINNKTNQLLCLDRYYNNLRIWDLKKGELIKEQTIELPYFKNPELKNNVNQLSMSTDEHYKFLLKTTTLEQFVYDKYQELYYVIQSPNFKNVDSKLTDDKTSIYKQPWYLYVYDFEFKLKYSLLFDPIIYELVTITPTIKGLFISRQNTEEFNTPSKNIKYDIFIFKE